MCFLNLARFVFAFSLHRNLILRVSSVFLVFVRLVCSLGISYCFLVALSNVCVEYKLYTPCVGSSSNFVRLCVEFKLVDAVCRL